MNRVCVKCGVALVPKEGAGRPSIYCGKQCRKTAELEIRRLNEQLVGLENNARHARLFGQCSTVWRPPEVYANEIAMIEARLHALFDSPGDTED